MQHRPLQQTEKHAHSRCREATFSFSADANLDVLPLFPALFSPYLFFSLPPSPSPPSPPLSLLLSSLPGPRHPRGAPQYIPNDAGFRGGCIVVTPSLLSFNSLLFCSNNQSNPRRPPGMTDVLPCSSPPSRPSPFPAPQPSLKAAPLSQLFQPPPYFAFGL